MNLTAHFTLEELIRSETAARHGIDNTPSEEVIANLRTLAVLLEQVRETLGGKPIHITSAYRSQAVNALVGSKPTSDHIHGMAADFVCPSFGNPHAVVSELVASGLPYKQVIREFDAWTHISCPAPGQTAKREALIIDKLDTRPFTL